MCIRDSFYMAQLLCADIRKNCLNGAAGHAVALVQIGSRRGKFSVGAAQQHGGELCHSGIGLNFAKRENQPCFIYPHRLVLPHIFVVPGERLGIPFPAPPAYGIAKVFQRTVIFHINILKRPELFRIAVVVGKGASIVGMRIQIKVDVNACLLYTSRCV